MVPQSCWVVVDTHVHRISRRLELTRSDDPKNIEQDLMKVVPQEKWIDYSHQIIHHGRALCIARKPKCAECPLETSAMPGIRRGRLWRFIRRQSSARNFHHGGTETRRKAEKRVESSSVFFQRHCCGLLPPVPKGRMKIARYGSEGAASAEEQVPGKQKKRAFPCCRRPARSEAEHRQRMRDTPSIPLLSRKSAQGWVTLN